MFGQLQIERIDQAYHLNVQKHDQSYYDKNQYLHRYEGELSLIIFVKLVDFLFVDIENWLQIEKVDNLIVKFRN